MAGDADIQNLNRTLKELIRSFDRLNHIVEAMNINLVELVKRIPPPPVTETTDV